MPSPGARLPAWAEQPIMIPGAFNALTAGWPCGSASPRSSWLAARDDAADEQGVSLVRTGDHRSLSRMAHVFF